MLERVPIFIRPARIGLPANPARPPQRQRFMVSRPAALSRARASQAAPLGTLGTEGGRSAWSMAGSAVPPPGGATQRQPPPRACAASQPRPLPFPARRHPDPVLSSFQKRHASRINSQALHKRVMQFTFNVYQRLNSDTALPSLRGFRGFAPQPRVPGTTSLSPTAETSSCWRQSKVTKDRSSNSSALATWSTSSERVPNFAE
jgi:hypothetical protein